MHLHSSARATLLSIAFALAAFGQAPTITSVSSNTGASSGQPVAPGELINISGSDFADASTACGGNTGIPNTCAGIAVTIGGKVAPVRNTNPTFLVVQVPVDAATGAAVLQLTKNGTPAAPFTISIAPTSPTLFLNNQAGVNVGNCFTAGVQILPNNPVNAGVTVRCVGTGFGATNPVVPTGTIQPQSPLPAVVAPVQVTVGGVTASGVSASMAIGTIVGQNQILFQVPATAGGTQPLVVTVGGVASPPVLLPIVAGAGPSVTSLVNSASNALAGFPNSGVAPGAIVVGYGKLLGPATLTVAPGYPWPETLSGTSASVTVNGVTTKLRLYYTSAGQIAGLLPSSTPPGTGTITVTYNGQTGSPSPIFVSANNFGIYTVSQNGSGEGIVTFADYSLVSAKKAANPGETLILWGTGLGAVTGDEAAGPLPGDMTSLPVQVWVGGQSADVAYRGRSGCCVGEDQIAFVVPKGVAGCIVPIAIQIGGRISNYASMAIAASGRICAGENPVVSSAFTSIPQPRILLLQLDREAVPPKTAPDSPDSQDQAQALPLTLGVSGAEVNAGTEAPPYGTCTVSPVEFPNYEPAILGTLDAGTSLSLRGPGGTRTLNKSDGTYSAALGDTTPGNFLDAGQYTLTGAGGKDIGAINAPFSIPQFAWTNRPSGTNSLTVTRGQGLTITWTGGDPNGRVQIIGSSSTATGATGRFACVARPADGKFTVPPAVLLALPAGNLGSVRVGMTANPILFTATGLDWAAVQVSLVYLGFATFQ